jgi:signal transduction histidine kinase
MAWAARFGDRISQPLSASVHPTSAERPALSRPATVTAIAVTVAACLAGNAISIWCAVVDHQSVLNAVLSSVVVTAFAVVGAVVAAARPSNPIGWLMLAGGVFWSLGGAAADLAYHGIVADPGSVTAASALAVGGAAGRSVGWYLVTIWVAVLFPDGRLAGPRWRWLKYALVVILVGSVLDPLTDPKADLTNFGAWQNPIGLAGPWRAVSGVAFLAHIPLSLVVTIAAVCQLVSRWRSGDARMRQQLLLFAWAVGITLIAVPIAFGLGGAGWIFAIAALPLPFAIGIAVLARGLYDLRTAANRSLVWATLSAVVAGSFALLIAGLSSALHVDRSSGWPVVIAATIVAIALVPLRDGLQRAVNRVTYGRWDEPYDVLAALGPHLIDGTAGVERLLDQAIVELNGLGLREVSIADANGLVLAGSLALAPDNEQLPLTAYGAAAGTLHFQPPESPLRSRDRRLLEDLAGQIGGILHAYAMAGDVQRARERLVLAREEERRRLRRDLHDGLGPALAGHLLRLDVLSTRVDGDSPAARDIDGLRKDLRETVGEIRRVVEGLRPPALDELGLAGALTQVIDRLTAGTPVAVEVRRSALPPLSAAIEVAVFRIVTEAVTNVVKHANARHCLVDLRVVNEQSEDDWLRIEITDDGAGLSATQATGHGLFTMRERAEELRGRVRLSRGPDGRGNSVIAELPLSPTPDLGGNR